MRLRASCVALLALGAVVAGCGDSGSKAPTNVGAGGFSGADDARVGIVPGGDDDATVAHGGANGAGGGSGGTGGADHGTGGDAAGGSGPAGGAGGGGDVECNPGQVRCLTEGESAIESCRNDGTWSVDVCPDGAGCFSDRCLPAPRPA